MPRHPPGTPVVVELDDGRRVKGKVMGTNERYPTGDFYYVVYVGLPGRPTVLVEPYNVLPADARTTPGPFPEDAETKAKLERELQETRDMIEQDRVMREIVERKAAERFDFSDLFEKKE